MPPKVVQMVINMYHGGPDACGSFTTGGTESILMAMKAHRDWGEEAKGITDCCPLCLGVLDLWVLVNKSLTDGWLEPNIVICTTAHAAFDKAGKYFKIQVRKARPDGDMAMDLKHMKQLIDRNTVAIVGSCCQYCHGTIDPIQEMGKERSWWILMGTGWLHTSCLGGFLVPFMEKAGYPLAPFDFRVPGVTSISCDPHKYGFAPKGSSVVMFSNKELRRYMYCYLTDWSGGIYATPTMVGSRPGGPVAATWAAMRRFGEDGYVQTTREIVGATRRIAEGLKQIDDLRLVGRPEVCVVAFDTKPGVGFSCYAVADCLKQLSGWELATCQNPPSVHLALTLLTAKHAESFVKDVKAAVARVKESPKLYNSTAGMYGMAATLPQGFIEDAVGAYIDAMRQGDEVGMGPEVQSKALLGQDNLAHGYGTYIHQNGTIYQGQFRNDLQDGLAIETWPDQSQFIGEFARGKKSGNGEYRWPDGSKYLGQWCMNMIDGTGIYIGVDGREYRGRWMDSQMHGCGRYQWVDGRCYQGQYVRDNKDGFGIFTWADGRRYEGYWSKGKQHGVGRLCNAQGSHRMAQWEKGERKAWLEEEQSGAG
eukprot:s82_g17.t1